MKQTVYLPVARRPRRPALPTAVAPALLVLLACQGIGPPGPPAASQLALQDGDLPSDLRRCPASGEIDAHLRALPPADRAARDELSTEWAELRRRGATGAAVAVYSAQPAACGMRLGTGPGASVSSLVVTFGDDAAAAGAYDRGMLGFTTPAEDQDTGDMTRGVATGLGRRSWVLMRSVAGRSLLVGLWERNRVAALVVAVDEDPLHAKQAMSGVDGRIP